MTTQTIRRPKQGRRSYSGSNKFESSFKRNKRPRGSVSSSGRNRFNSTFSGKRGGSQRNKRKQPSFDPSQFINKNPVEIKEVPYEAKYTFKNFGLHADIVKTVEKQGITSPSPIQDQAIPLIMEGKDLIGLAETGTGKTAAFLLPLIQKTITQRNQVTLILTPTRELALQAEAEFKKFASGFKIYATCCVGGMNIRPQIRALKRNNHFIIGTPGRIIDLIDKGDLRTNRINNVVLDEADRMLDMGFVHDMRKILENVTKNRQTLFFSATMTKEAEELVNDFMHSPVTVSVKKKDVTDSIAQDIVPFEHTHKIGTLLSLLAKDELKRVIIFGGMKHSVEKLSKELCQNGIKAESIHGNKSHGQRQHSLNAFKSGNARVLVATDVAARGIHVDNVSHVINYDLPSTFEDYIHRIGRTGRGTKRGEALTFVPKKN